jgi:hypothetical protein
MMYSSLLLGLGMTAAAAAIDSKRTPTPSEDFGLHARLSDVIFTLGVSRNGTERTVYLYSVRDEDLAAKAFTTSTSNVTSLAVHDGTNFAGLQVSSIVS